MDQIFTLAEVLRGSWEFDHRVHICFVVLEKAYDYVPQEILWGVLQRYGVLKSLLRAIWSLYNQSKSCVCILSTRSNLFTIRIGLCQGCPLSWILFVIFMGWISRRSLGEEGVWFGDLRFTSLADDVILLASSSHDLQCALEQLSVKRPGWRSRSWFLTG